MAVGGWLPCLVNKPGRVSQDDSRPSPSIYREVEMGKWRKVEPVPYSPCSHCEMGHCSISSKVVDGVLHTKTDECYETCERLRGNNQTPEVTKEIRDKSHEKLGDAWEYLATH